MRIISFLITAVAVFLLAGCQTAPGSSSNTSTTSLSFVDTFDRSDATDPGNGWTPSFPAGGSVTISNRILSLFSPGLNTSGIYRTFTQFSGGFEISVKFLMNSPLQVWMQQTSTNLYIVDAGTNGIDIRNGNTTLSNLAVSLTINTVYSLLFKKAGSVLTLSIASSVNPSSSSVLQVIDSSYNNFYEAQFWGGGNGGSTRILSISIASQ